MLESLWSGLICEGRGRGKGSGEERMEAPVSRPGEMCSSFFKKINSMFQNIFLQIYSLFLEDEAFRFNTWGNVALGGGGGGEGGGGELLVAGCAWRLSPLLSPLLFLLLNDY